MHNKAPTHARSLKLTVLHGDCKALTDGVPRKRALGLRQDTSGGLVGDTGGDALVEAVSVCMVSTHA